MKNNIVSIKAARSNKSAAHAAIDPQLRTSDMAEIFRCSDNTIYRRVKNGSLPKPHKNGGLNLWSLSEIQPLIS
jgi:predicted DNA-binding transcriptional regulator AlpA